MKPDEIPDIAHHALVAPIPGAWIETINEEWIIKEILVAPIPGAWIETL